MRARTHIIFMFRGHGVNEVVFAHEKLPRGIVFAGMTEEVGLDLVRSLGLTGASHQGLFHGILDAGHCGV